MEADLTATNVRIGSNHHHDHHEWRGQTDQQRIADLSDKVGNLHRDTVGVVEKTGTAGALASCKTDDGVTASTSEVKTAVALSSDRSADRDCLTQTQVGSLGTSVVAYAKDAQATAYQIEGRQGLALAERSNAILVDAQKNFYALSVENVKNASASELTAERNFNAVTLQAEKIAAAAALAAQECCCKLEMKIEASGNETRALIHQIDRDRSGRELIRAENEIMYLKSRVPAGTPV